MNPYEHIKQRQVLWALRRGIPLGGQFRYSPDPSEAERGEKLFTLNLDDNLFEPLMPEARQEYEAGDGGELRGRMNAVHSSSAIAVNVFHYWRSRHLEAEIAKACRVPSTRIREMRFEGKYPIRDEFKRPPNIDVVIDYDDQGNLKATAVECKFNEPFGGWQMKGLRDVYLRHEELWADLPNLRQVAEAVSPDNTRFVALDAPQLIKHVLGLKRAYGKRGFRLLYLWYEMPGRQSVRHADELAEFASYLERDGVTFQSLTYQEVIVSLARHQRVDHQAFVDYLAERYF